MFDRRSSIYIITILVICALVQVMITKYFPLYDLQDYLFYTIGGVTKNESLLRLLVWMVQFIPLIYLMSILFCSNKFDTWVLTRSVSRFKWFISKWIILILTTIGYGTLIIIVYTLVGIFYFPLESSIGGIDIDHLSLVYSIIIFFSGMIALSSIGTVISSMWNNVSVGYIFFLLLTCLCFLIWNSGTFPSFLSPLTYPISIEFIINADGFIYAVLSNLMVIIGSFMLNLIVSIKRTS